MLQHLFFNAIRICRKNFILLSCLVAFSAVGCGSKKESVYPSPEGYNINKPFVTKLPPMLDEISGIYYYPKDKSLFAIHDERGWLYKIHLDKNLTIDKWKYAPGADFEDVAVADSTFFAIKSNGNLVAFRFARPDSAVLQTFHLPGKPNFETLYVDSSRQVLLMVCKIVNRMKEYDQCLRVRLQTNEIPGLTGFAINAKQIEKRLGDKMPKFKPSAAAINPKTGELFLISSVNKVLVVAESDGKVIDVFQLDPILFKQPEGLTFTPEGDLLISNESAGVGPATILLFKYNQSRGNEIPTEPGWINSLHSSGLLVAG
jgi:uncharacterized protein YjiK